ncbi:MAG: hypothetical protein ACJAWV_003556 [Flammeovirgaceae bacterium]|jgi:hypothetical protein
MESENKILKIRQLLDKYWACEASESEEDELKNYFNSGNIAEEFREFQPMFQFFKQQKSAKLDGKFESQLLGKLEPKKLTVSKNQWFRNFAKVAASLLLILTCAYFFTNPQNPTKTKVAVLEDTYEDPKEAYEAVRKALMQVSGSLNEGAEYAVSIQKINKGAEALGIEEEKLKMKN